MKYSEYLLKLAEIATRSSNEHLHLCFLIGDYPHPEHSDKLRKTITKKIRAMDILLYSPNAEINSTTLYDLTRMYAKKGLNLTPKQARIKWLKDLAKHHAARGN